MGVKQLFYQREVGKPKVSVIFHYLFALPQVKVNYRLKRFV